MKRRSFFKNLIGSVSVLVSAYALPSNKIRIGRDRHGLFEPGLYSRTFRKSPWTGLIKRGEWPKGMGETIRMVSYEKSNA